MKRTYHVILGLMSSWRYKAQGCASLAWKVGPGDVGTFIPDATLATHLRARAGKQSRAAKTELETMNDTVMAVVR